MDEDCTLSEEKLWMLVRSVADKMLNKETQEDASEPLERKNAFEICAISALIITSFRIATQNEKGREENELLITDWVFQYTDIIAEHFHGMSVEDIESIERFVLRWGGRRRPGCDHVQKRSVMNFE
jgi:hypothetical protein